MNKKASNIHCKKFLHKIITILFSAMLTFDTSAIKKNSQDKKNHTLKQKKNNSVFIRIGNLIRNKTDIANRVRLQACMLGIPEIILEKYIELQSERVTIEYQDELRKLFLIKTKAKELLYSEDNKQFIETMMSKYKNHIQQYQVPEYIVKEYFQIQYAFKMFVNKYHVGGISVSTQEQQLFLKNLLEKQKNLNAFADENGLQGYLISEIVLDKKYLIDEDAKNTILAVIQNLIQNQTHISVIAMSLSQDLSNTLGGNLGMIPKQNIQENLLAKIESSDLSNVVMIINHEERGLVLYFIHQKIYNQDLTTAQLKEKISEHGVKNFIYQEKFTQQLHDLYSNTDSDNVIFVKN